MKKKDDLIIKELFPINALKNRTFIATINRGIVDGFEFVAGEVIVNEGRIWSIGVDENQLGNNLDMLSLMKLDFDLHGNSGIYFENAGLFYFLN